MRLGTGAVSQTDMDNLADIIWWIKGYLAGCADLEATNGLHERHIESLRKVRSHFRRLQVLNEKL
jgi:hypothetical protein